MEYTKANAGYYTLETILKWVEEDNQGLSFIDVLKKQAQEKERNDEMEMYARFSDESFDEYAKERELNDIQMQKDLKELEDYNNNLKN